MTLNKREKILAACVGGIGLLTLVFLGWQYLGASGGKSLADLQRDSITLSAAVKDKEKRINDANKKSVMLAEWQRRSLPSDIEVGRTLYQNWLRDLVNKSGIRGAKIDASPGQPRRGIYEEFRYTVAGKATLQQLTRFLYDFYRAGHLHKISILKLDPLNNSKDIDVNITVEALSLAGADRRDKLTTEPSDRPKKKSYEEYDKMIVTRNIFVAYTSEKPPKEISVKPPREEVKPPTPKFDHLEFSKLTAIIEADGHPEAWIETKTTGQLVKAKEGEEVTVASAKVKILRIGVREIILQLGDEKRTILLGQNLLGK